MIDEQHRVDRNEIVFIKDGVSLYQQHRQSNEPGRSTNQLFLLKPSK